MDYYDAITEVLEKAANIKLRGHRLDVVSVARREFAKRGCCDSKFIDPIEQTLRECLRHWSLTQKREIWESTESGVDSDLDFDAYAPESIDLDLEGELMYQLIAHLSPHKKGKGGDGDEDDSWA